MITFTEEILNGRLHFLCSEFIESYKVLVITWPKEFVKWMETTKFRLRSLKSTIEKCMLIEVRVAAGLRNPPNKWVNNRMESLNLVIKEQINNNAVDMVTFLEAVKEKVFDQQLEELVKGIYGIGEYRLVEELSSYQVDPVRWVSMTTDQRKALVEKVMCINIKDFERTPYDNNTLNLSIFLKECALIIVLPLSTLEELWERTKFLI